MRISRAEVVNPIRIGGPAEVGTAGAGAVVVEPGAGRGLGSSCGGACVGFASTVLGTVAGGAGFGTGAFAVLVGA